MILVDTSVLIDFFAGNHNSKSQKFRRILEGNFPFGITSLVMQEVLQGVSNEAQFKKLEDYLSSLNIYAPVDQIESHSRAAKLYFKLRKKGITVRSTIDCLIVQIAKEHNLSILHNDKDFDILMKEAKVESV